MHRPTDYVAGEVNGTEPPSFWKAFRFWLTLGLTSFGGPAGQIATMHLELVERKRWVPEKKFLNALNFCMLLPGPEAQQLAIYIGWLLHGLPGGLAAGVLFVLPAAVLLWTLSWVYVTFGEAPWLSGVFYGLKPAVLGIVIFAIGRLGKKALKTRFSVALACLGFCAIFFLKLPFPWLLACAAACGLLHETFFSLSDRAGATVSSDSVDAVPDCKPAAALGQQVSFVSQMGVAAVGLCLWWCPVLLAALWLGKESVLFRQGVFFSKASMVTFGGAYAVLPYVSQQAVESFGWLSGHQMLDGLAFAETTPGPLIIVLEFVGFLGAWNNPGTLPPLLSATLGALMTLWCTFVPCFIWIFLGAPYIERLQESRKVNGALSAVSAAVVGVILNLVLWFGQSVLWPGQVGFDWVAFGISAAAIFALERFHWGTLSVVLCAGNFGVLYRFWVGF